ASSTRCEYAGFSTALSSRLGLVVQSCGLRRRTASMPPVSATTTVIPRNWSSFDAMAFTIQLAQLQYPIIGQWGSEMIKAGGRRGFRNRLTARVQSFNPQSRSGSGKMPLKRRLGLCDARTPPPRQCLEPFGLGPQPKTAIRNLTVAPQTVH